jgi:IS5 family transposase
MATDDFFRARLDSMIDMRHPLVVLATRMPWAEIEASLAPVLAHKDRSGRLVRTPTCSVPLRSSPARA